MKNTLGTMVAIIVVAILMGTFIMAKYASAGETVRDGHFIAYSDGVVLDTQTKLMWAANDNGSDINWMNAGAYCRNYRGGGYKDWRMPTQAELAGLYDKGKVYKAACGFDVYLTKLILLTCKWVWASETRGSDSAYFNFIDGHRPWFSSVDAAGMRVLPVRSHLVP